MSTLSSNRVLISALASLAVASLASADTRAFQGVNWAVLGDNFVEDILVLHGLEESDDYDTVRAIADVIYTGFEDNLGINTIRLPVNTHTTGSTWWDAYSGVIDAASDRDIKVILAYWEDGAASAGKIVDYNAWNTMWDIVVDKYGNDSLIHFEPMNEPHGYTAAAWKDVAAGWIDRYSFIPRERLLIGGTGYSQDARPICADSRFDGTLVSHHVYEFMRRDVTTYDGWLKVYQDGVGDSACSSRIVTTEFGAPMDKGFDYEQGPDSGENFVRYFHAVTELMRELRIGSTYWPALGGKITAGQSDDHYSIQKMTGTGTDLTLTTPSVSGSQRLFYGWGRPSAC
ncbi:glycoside hydrolase superfamily [Plectosphaerella plurivora]|uniref:Glycoside hydrolase superfamily n=1 Tax=Plectosphaerella plurivora TaxID=936078 RepID=A0A9P8V3G6_9PEZI|nr:glycoside hydrolase superfamily [Plectosphaerella plurivora]